MGCWEAGLEGLEPIAENGLILDSVEMMIFVSVDDE